MTNDESARGYQPSATGHKPSAISYRLSAITGATRLVGVIGWPVSHSRSPAMHNAAFAALELDWTYVPLPVPPERVGDAVRGLAALGFAGANVTVPHKQAVIPFLDDLTPVARAVGAVNTIVVRPDGSLLGDNTDGAGFMADLRAQGVEFGCGRARTSANATIAENHPRSSAFIRVQSVVVVGAGGAARAVAYALAEAGATIAIVNRTLDRAQKLCQAIAAPLPLSSGQITAHLFPDALADLAAEANLIVNATSLGLHEGDPLPWDTAIPFRPDQVVCDLIYNRPTELLARARAQGAIALDGLGMLVHQGARAFELWTGMAAPVEVMLEAIRAA